MNARRLAIAGGLFVLAAFLFVWRKRAANYAAEERQFMGLAALCGLAAIFLLCRARKATKP